MEWTPPFHSVTTRQQTDTDVVYGQRVRGASIDNVSIIGIDIWNRTFEVHGGTVDGVPVRRWKLTRGKVVEFLASQPLCSVVILVVIETSGGAHHLGWEIHTYDAEHEDEASRTEVVDSTCSFGL